MRSFEQAVMLFLPNYQLIDWALRKADFFLMFLYMYRHLFKKKIPCLVFEEPEDPSNRSFFSEIISSISDVKFSHNGRYMMTRDYLSVKIWDLNMENRPVETYQVSQVLATRLHTCSLVRRNKKTEASSSFYSSCSSKL